MALLAVTLLVASPFLYCFSRLAILEPMLIAFTLAALNLAVRLDRVRRPVWASVAIGLLFTLMMLTKTTALFLLPAVGWAMLLPLWRQRPLFLRCAAAAGAAAAASFGLWMALVVRLGVFTDYKYLFYVNTYPKPKELYWPLLSLWWSIHGGLWIDRMIIPLADMVVVGAAIAATPLARRQAWARGLLLNPVFGASILAVAGYIFFMTYQNHPQPRYYTVVAFFAFFVVAQGAESLLGAAGRVQHILGWAIVAFATLDAAVSGAWTLNYGAHPEYTFVDAAGQLTRYIDQHPNGKRLLVSISGDQISLVTHLPALCDDFSTPSDQFPDLPHKLAYYQPGWYATWNDLDPGTLEDLHNHFSLEQVASFRAFDDPDRNLLVLFKLHPLPGGKVREQSEQNLQIALPDDKIDIPVE
jgi:4-amino-4-deoxy-L-arabinose transferase-like glycosyltransferase